MNGYMILDKTREIFKERKKKLFFAMIGASFIFLIIINIMHYVILKDIIDYVISLLFLIFFISSWFLSFKVLNYVSKTPCEILNELEPKNSIIKNECSHLIIKNGICSSCKLDFNNNSFEITKNGIIFDDKNLKKFDDLLKEEIN